MQIESCETSLLVHVVSIAMKKKGSDVFIFIVYGKNHTS